MPVLLGHRWSWLLPAAALGLFAGRLLSELLRPGLPLALLLTGLCLFLAAALLRGRPPALTWPGPLLLAYIFYGEADPTMAGRVAQLAALTALLAATTGLRPGRRVLQAGGLLLSLLFLLLYVATLAPDVLPADSGELQLAAVRLGVAHPPGFPLYTMLGHLASRLPLPAATAYRVNLLSAVIAAATLLLAYLTVARLARSAAAGVLGTLALGTSTTFWAQATTANVRSLTAFFAALAFYALVAHRDEIKSGAVALSGRWLLLLALAIGFGLSHHTSLVFIYLVLAFALALSDPDLVRAPRRWLRPLGFALLGLLPLLYLPLRAAAGAWGAPADLTTLPGFLNHVLALGFRGDFFAFVAPADLALRLLIMANVMAFQFTPLLLAGMLLGWLLCLRYDRWLALLLGGSFAVHTLVTATYRAPQTVEYMLPAYLPAVYCLGYLAGRLRQPLPDTATGRWLQPLRTVAVALFLMAASWQGWQRWPSYAALHRDHTARDYARPILEQAPPGSVVLADWHWSTPLWYLQQVEGRRPDLDVRYVFPTAEPYAQTWAGHIAEEVGRGRPVVATHFDSAAFAALPAAQPLGDAFLYAQEPRLELPPAFSPLSLTLGGRIALLGYLLEPATTEIGQEARLTLAWRPLTGLEAGTTLFAHLIGRDLGLYAQQDVAVQPAPAGLTLTQFRLTPRPGALPGDHAVMVGAYGSQPLPDDNGRTRSPIAVLTVRPASLPPYTRQPLFRAIADESLQRQLVGYDWDTTLPGAPRLYLHWQTAAGHYSEVRDGEAAAGLPIPAWYGPWGLVVEGQPPGWSLTRLRPIWDARGHYVPLGQGLVWLGGMLPDGPLAAGERLTLWLRFAAARPVTRDLVVSLRLVGYEADDLHWAWWDLNDTVPAMGAMPTLKWIAGSVVADPHRVAVNSAAPPGQQVGAILVVYDAFTGRPLPVLDERIGQQGPGIMLGAATAGRP